MSSISSMLPMRLGKPLENVSSFTSIMVTQSSGVPPYSSGKPSVPKPASSSAWKYSVGMRCSS